MSLPNTDNAAEYINIAHESFKRNVDKMPEDVQTAFRVVFMLALHGMASQMMYNTALTLREILPDGTIEKEELNRLLKEQGL